MPPSSLESVRAALAQRAPRRAEAPIAAQAAVALVLARGPGGDLELLLIRRAECEGDPWSGHMALPGGRRDPGDPDLLATARRETLEEVAVDLPPQGLLGELDDLAPLSAARAILVRPFVFGLAARPEVRASREVDFHVWAPLPELAASAGATRVFHRGELRTLPCYRAGAHAVWGMTQRILQPFLAVVHSAR